jgi:hypothetical protein
LFIQIQKTDERILGTYTKSPGKAKKKKPDGPARKVAYDVYYPAPMGECRPHTISIFLPQMFRFGEIIMFIIYQLEDSTKKKCPAHDFKHPFGIGGERDRKKKNKI